MPDLSALGSLSGAQQLFAGLKAPGSLEGRWAAAFTGPGWLTTLAPLGLAASPLVGWCGKTFDANGQGLNLVRRGGQLQAIVPMRVVARASAVDGALVLATEYNADAPWLLRGVADEFRVLDAERLLGLMTVSRPGLRWVAFPFLLTRNESLT
jgi:hypothetical protein